MTRVACISVAVGLLVIPFSIAQNENTQSSGRGAKASTGSQTFTEAKEPIHVKVDSTPWERLLGPIGGGISALAGVALPFLFRWWQRPRLTAPSQVLPGSTRVVPDQDLFGVSQRCTYLRLRIRNYGKKAAEQCYAVMTDVQYRPTTASGWVATQYADTLELRWASATPVPGLGIQLVPNIDYYLDLMCLAETSAVIVPVFNRDPMMHAGLFAKAGDYKLTVIVTSADCAPITAEVITNVSTAPLGIRIHTINQLP